MHPAKCSWPAARASRTFAALPARVALLVDAEALVYAKLNACDAMGTCMHVTRPHEDVTNSQNDDCCPLGVEKFRGSIVYEENGLTEEETLYLVKSHSANDGVVAGGSTGDLRTYKVTPGDDTISPNTGVFEFTGAQHGCVPQTSVSLSLHDRAAPKTAEAGLPPIILGDISTPRLRTIGFTLAIVSLKIGASLLLRQEFIRVHPADRNGDLFQPVHLRALHRRGWRVHMPYAGPVDFPVHSKSKGVFLLCSDR